MPEDLLSQAIIDDYIQSRGWRPGQLGNFQDWNGLASDDWCGPQTTRMLTAPRMCGHPDVMESQEAARLRKWNKNDLTWGARGTLPGISVTRMLEIFSRAFASWNVVCNIKFTYSGAPPYDIEITTGVIDTAGNILAWSEMPPQPDLQVTQKYDTAETWGMVVPPNVAEIGLLNVGAHEIGHTIGIPHIRKRLGGPSSLMNPFYNASIWEPQRDDSLSGVARYGDPAEPPLDDDDEVNEDTIWLGAGGVKFKITAKVEAA